MSQSSPETTPAPTATSQTGQTAKTETKPKDPLDVFRNGDDEVTGNGTVTPEMRVVAWNEGYHVIDDTKKNGDWKVVRRTTE